MSAAEFELKIQKEGITYIPKKLREQYGLRPKILPNETAGVIYKTGAKTTDIIGSLQVLIQHLKLRMGKEVKE